MRPPSKTALFVAAKRWDAAAINSIAAAAPALIEAADPKGRTALHIACGVKPDGALGERNDIGTVTVLLKAGADLERAVPMAEDEGEFRATPLWYAVARGENSVWRDDPVLCRELLNTNPRLNLRAHGETPIFYAARLKRLKTLDLLIAAGADPTIPDPQGRDAVAIARARSLPKEIINRLAELTRRM
jgi:ankyrin repeat protein